MNRENIEFAIEIHCGFMIKDWVEKVRNCSVPKDKQEAKKFKNPAEAKKFINLHDGDGLNKKTAKIVEV